MDKETFDRALDEPGEKIIAWDLTVQDGELTISVFSLAGGGARQVAWRTYPVEEKEAVSQDLLTRGFSLGEYDFMGAPFVWHVSPDGVTVWSRDERAIVARDRTLTYFLGRTLSADDIDAFVAYVDNDYVDRGVKAQLKSGQLVTVIFELSAAAQADPTYSRNDLLMASEWCCAIAHVLASWAGVSYKNTI